MNELDFLTKLLDGAEIEWKPLGSVTQYEEPTKYLVKTKEYSNEFTTPVLTAGKTFILGYTDEVTGVYEASKSPVIIFDDLTVENKWVDFDFKARLSTMKMITSRDETSFLIKYIYYWLNTLTENRIEGNHKRQWISNFCNKKIPIPCPDNPTKSLAIQNEIVRILDTAAALAAELEVELKARRRQYEYYRNALLNFKDSVVFWKPLGELTTIKTGQSIDKKYIASNPGQYPVINSGLNPLGYIDKWNTENDPICVASRGYSVGLVTWQEGKFFRGNLNYAISVNPNAYLNVRFLYHLLIQLQPELHALCTYNWIPVLNASNLKKLLIPIPHHENSEKSLLEQTRITAALDKFEAITTSFSEGLPREIALRQQQYKFYRDLLFSFPNHKQAA